MIRIGLLSDTHGFIDDKLLGFFNDCDELWHAGDVGNIQTLDNLRAFKPVRAVYGNIDGHELRGELTEELRFKCEGYDVWMKHIGGYPGRYDYSVWKRIAENPPDIFISGHSHILKVINDKKLDLVHMNPGACGNSGLHRVKTAIRFTIDGKKISDMDVWEMKR